jgi:hypothetical protein
MSAQGRSIGGNVKEFFRQTGENVLNIPGSLYEAVKDPAKVWEGIKQETGKQYDYVMSLPPGERQFQWGRLIPGLGPATANVANDIDRQEYGRALANALFIRGLPESPKVASAVWGAAQPIKPYLAPLKSPEVWKQAGVMAAKAAGGAATEHMLGPPGYALGSALAAVTIPELMGQGNLKSLASAARDAVSKAKGVMPIEIEPYVPFKGKPSKYPYTPGTNPAESMPPRPRKAKPYGKGMTQAEAAAQGSDTVSDLSNVAKATEATAGKPSASSVPADLGEHHQRWAEYGGPATIAKNQTIAQRLYSEGKSPADWNKMSLQEQSDFIVGTPHPNGPTYKYGSLFVKASTKASRTPQKVVSDIGEALGGLWGK